MAHLPLEPILARCGARQSRHASFEIPFNTPGATAWVVMMSMAGILLAKTFDRLLEYHEKASWGITVVVAGAGYYVWRRKNERYKKRKP